jgi:hypothetical protein
MALNTTTPAPSTNPTQIMEITSFSPAMPAPQNDLVSGARHAALQFLIKQTKRWSDIHTMQLDNSTNAHIVVTFINPELVQAIYLNEILEHTHVAPDIEQSVIAVMNQVASRDELLFLVTIIFTSSHSTFPSGHTLDIPITEMRLINAEDLPVPPLHDDHNLDQAIDSNQIFEYGFLGYPIGVQDNGICAWVLNPQFNTNIVIVSDPASINSVPGKNKHTWTIPYKPLIDTGIPIGLPDFGIPPYDSSVYTPSLTPPERIEPINEFWHKYSRFVWGQITFENK